MYYDKREPTKKGGLKSMKYYLKRPILRDAEEREKHYNYDHLILGKQIQISVFDPLRQYQTFNKKIERP